MPPPPEDESVKPMSYVGATMWAVGATIIFIWLVMLANAMRGEPSADYIGQLLCQVAAYSLALYLVLRVHAPNTRIRDFLAMRMGNPWFYPLAIVIGASITYPADWVLELIEKRYPPPEQLFDLLDVFYDASPAKRVALTVGFAVVGPFIEEVFYRGALYRPLFQNKRPIAVVATTAVLFALAHLNPHATPVLIVLGGLLAYLRWASGSLIPPYLMHVAFNAMPFLHHLQYEAKPPESDAPISLVAGGAGICAIALLFTHALATSSRRASGARRGDV